MSNDHEQTFYVVFFSSDSVHARQNYRTNSFKNSYLPGVVEKLFQVDFSC